MGQFLPNKAYVGGINLDPGSYAVAVQFASGTRYEYDVEVNEGSLNLIDAFCLKTGVGPPTTVARTAASQSDGQSTTVAVSTVAQAPAISAPISNKRYEVVDQSVVSWTMAKAAAESRGGYLAVITSAQEQETIENMVKMSGNNHGYWIGGFRDRGGWEWVNNEPMKYKNWARYEPRNENGRYGRMYMARKHSDTRNKLGQWYELNENTNWGLGYIIEWD
jgi:hypothetical protein